MNIDMQAMQEGGGQGDEAEEEEVEDVEDLKGVLGQVATARAMVTAAYTMDTIGEQRLGLSDKQVEN